MIKKIKGIYTKVDEELLAPEERTDKLYAVGALFNTPDEIMHAADVVSGSGYQNFDVNTPYPLHGMDDAMRLEPTKLGLFTFIFGMMGTLTAFSMIAWMMGIDYPNIIGGKPFFNIPPSIPIAFELTVLLGALGTVGTMLILFNRLPWINNPLHDTDYIRKTSSDKFGIVIRADDPMFNEAQVNDLYGKLGSKDVINIYHYAVEEEKVKTPIFDAKFLATVGAVGVVAAIVSYLILRVALFEVPFDWMWKQFKVTPQDKSEFFADQYGVRTPPKGTVAQGYMPYEYAGMPDSVVKLLSNPLPLTEKNLEKGKNRYNTYCSPCHGYYGNGDSRLKGAFPNPPTLNSEKVRNWQDGNIYHVITNGQNVMPSYAKQISRDDRWAIVYYLRALQRSQNAKDEDLPK